MNMNRIWNGDANQPSYKLKPNDKNHGYHYKDYQDQQETIALKGSDNAEVRDLKGKMKTVMVKLANTKKQKQALQKQNKTLSEEIVTLQNNLRQMVSGFANTSSNFPINNQLFAKIAQFYKCDCLDLFFDMLCPAQLSMKGLIYFYFQAFHQANELIDQYLQPAFSSVTAVGCFQSIQGPIMNVLRKSFQSTYITMLQKIANPNQMQQISKQILTKLSINLQQDKKQQIINFLKKLIELLLCCKICDPPLYVDLSNIGKKVKYNPLRNDLMDGFINPKDECWVVLPEVKKCDENGDNFTKSVVLKVDYDLVN